MITFRQAVIDDSEFIARGFLTAMWIPEEEQSKILTVCREIARMDDSLYSWRNAVIAQCNGQDAAVLISYDGAIYAEAGKKTFEFIRDNGGDDFTRMTHEAETGEWYLDTLAVLPEFRRKGIATALLEHGIEQGMSKPGINAVTLYVDPNHPWVVELYSSIGFVHAGEAIIFGGLYKKMEVRLERMAE